MLIDTPALCSACARRQEVETVLERASVGEERPRTVTENPIERDALRISLAKDMYDAARRAYGQQVGGSLEALGPVKTNKMPRANDIVPPKPKSGC